MTGIRPDKFGRGTHEMKLTGVDTKDITAGAAKGLPKHSSQSNRRSFFVAAVVSAGLMLPAAVHAADEAAPAATTAAATTAAATAPAPATDTAATVALVAQIPLPLARPVQPGEGPVIGVGYIAQQYAQFQNAVSEAVSAN
ncbi:MAG: hypothetical protein RLN89_06475, partial [Parvibaculum sp.]